MNIVPGNFKVNNEVVITITVKPDETTVQIAAPDVAKNTYKAPAESEQNDSDKFNSIETIDWQKVQEFVEENNIELNDIESGVLGSYIKYGRISSAKQATVLGFVLKKVQARGFKPSYPF
ncbi:hypothetical protein HDR61_01650 [bacterium]|nr:hypothetical protein [bacterium]